ncbi:MAG TPA: Dabb family protein [Gemmatimonadales bacterium]|nr:Dabb family protein [Gemmatimonadales bacterium]
MIQHIVLFRFRADADPEAVAAAGAALRAMPERIAEIRGLHFGPNVGPSAAEWSHVLVVTCDDMAAVERYGDHPVHRDTVARFLAPIREARLAVDVETPA